MPTHSEAIRLNLEYYRKQAKALLKEVQAGDAGALERLSRHTRTTDRAAAKLHDAQLTIAREQGFPSWPRFRAFLVQSGLDDAALVAEFIDAAVSDRRKAEEMLAAHPGLAEGGFYAALVLGDWKQVERAVKVRPEVVKGASGPQKCDPLLYVCFSRFGNRASERAAGVVETARVLLRHGADPNVAFTPEDLPHNPLPCLYAATGLNNNAALGQVLLEAGANPNDGESLYHSTEHADLECVKLLLRHGALPGRANALKHMLDREDLEGVRVLLEAGADPNEVNEANATALHWAVWRGRSAAIVKALVDGGADVDAVRHDGRTAYAIAVRSGLTEVASLLEARGAKTELSAEDRFVGACVTASAEELERLLAAQPGMIGSGDVQRLLPDLAMSHRTGAVRALLAAGVPVDTRGDLGGTSLHWACWKGYADVVEAVLAKDASLTVEDTQFHGTPAGWFGHGTRNCHEGGGDYAAVARLLIAAGATIAAADVPTGREEVDAVLREHGVIGCERG